MRLFVTVRRTPVVRATHPDRDSGFVLVWFALLLVVLLGLTAFAVDFGHAYLVSEQAQSAADAAALSGAPYLPADCAGAKTRAHTIATNNGFTNATSGATVTVTTNCDDPTGPKPNQIRVDVTQSFETWFAKVIGVNTLKVHRTAYAEYDPPVNLGSPASNFGYAPGCSAGCFNSQMSANIGAEYNDKRDGNAITNGWCGNPADNCPAGASNSDRDKNGELFEIDNGSAHPLRIQLYDPAFIDTFDGCDHDFLYGTGKGIDATFFPPSVWGTAWLASHPAASDRPDHSGVAPQFCTGDDTDGVVWKLNNTKANPNDAANPGDSVYQDPAVATNTTYSLYELDDPSNPLSGRFLCSFTYKGYWGPANIPKTSPPDVAEQAFHHWDDFTSRALCPALTGVRYTLQVQTGRGISQPLGGISDTDGTVGSNNFDINACGGCATATADPAVHISALTKMGLYTHADPNFGPPIFYVARVPSWAAGQSLTLDFYDVGDAALGIDPITKKPGTLTLKITSVDATHGPAGASVGEFASCRYADPVARGVRANKPAPWAAGASNSDWGPLKNTPDGPCEVTITTANQFSWNGKWVVFDIPIPTDYTCDDTDFTKCWIQLQYSDENVQLFDTTTWFASLSGDPVRLIK